jgi:hypothetical protein
MISPNKHLLSVVITDPGADKSVPVLRADENITIEAAYVCADTTVGASTADYYAVNLLNGGVAGTETTNIGGTVGGVAGWVANTPKSLAITAGSGKLTTGQWLVAKYNEEGTVAPGRITVVVEYVRGVGSAAAA